MPLVVAAAPLTASPSLNLWGATGLIDLPSAEMQPDGVLNTSYARFSGIAR
ncbi:MAG: YjbH domain-containing protein, partial [Paracoccaceae bacterium]|nr:YjbH domain-containing protein [Paracoccaceae bacterium]